MAQAFVFIMFVIKDRVYGHEDLSCGRTDAIYTYTARINVLTKTFNLPFEMISIVFKPTLHTEQTLTLTEDAIIALHTVLLLLLCYYIIPVTTLA